MSKIFLVDLESVETRYTSQWKTHVPKLLEEAGHDVRVINGPNDVPSSTTPGAFLNFGGTNIYKAAQISEMGRLFTDGVVSSGDHFLFTDAWHPGILNLKYMSELLGIDCKIHALWHAGSYDPQDFLGRLIGDAKWVRHAEQAFYHAIDYNYFATDFHIDLFAANLLKLRSGWREWSTAESHRMFRAGWPMEYMEEVLTPYKTVPKKNQIIFPHRIAPEKQVEIFRDLAASMSEYEWVVCQDRELSKHEYHTLLAQSKIVFSANLQETLGISCYEGMIVGCMPLVPSRLSYNEMYSPELRYPSAWTEDWDSYQRHKPELIDKIRDSMTNFHYRWNHVYNNKLKLQEHYFSAKNILKNFV